ncbi:polysaccharide pyruvyl transferase family protein [Desulfopila inferna]|uniref:polysaccharide pyruvyl transferase family protein n=1 Tax=Desulfopila inferna TaxID=468528 RepID=UPI001966345A|nr:polysaccharide pyruvyl transferase family protein [Desulfopila inferna]MBM9602715.1 polysaccharide pyruvyl transferase family protein [Desulfopila inferna]
MKKYFERLGLTGSKGRVRAFWWTGEGNRNFGDIITPYLIEKITGRPPLLCNKHCFAEHYIMTGSVIEVANRNSIVWGTGMMYRHQKIRRPKKVLAVRGPITRKGLLELGYECPEIYGDPALLLPRFYRPTLEKVYALGLIPHFVDYRRVKEHFSGRDKILVIDLLNPVEHVIDQIYRCETTISSSLHGVIVSQAYGIPSVWVRFSDDLSGDGTKFRDYFLSVNIQPYEHKRVDLTKKVEPALLDDIAALASAVISIDLDGLMDACPLRHPDI